MRVGRNGMVPFAAVEILVFFVVGSLLLSLPWRFVVALFERVPANPGLKAMRYALLLSSPVVLSVAFVFATLGPWDSAFCQTLHHACLDHIVAWRFPVSLAIPLAIVTLVVLGRLIHPFRWHLRQRVIPATLSSDLTAKWELVEQAVARQVGGGVVPIQVVQAPTHLCHVRGVFRPRLCLSEAVLRELDHEELVGAICHEMAHVRRQDLPIGLLAFLSFCLLFFTPVGRRCYQRYLEEREYAADDWAVERTGAPLALASALGKVSKIARSERVPMAASLLPGGPLLATRLHRLMRWPSSSSTIQPQGEVAQLLLIGLVGLAGSAGLLSLHLRFEEWGLAVLKALGVVA